MLAIGATPAADTDHTKRLVVSDTPKIYGDNVCYMKFKSFVDAILHQKNPFNDNKREQGRGKDEKGGKDGGGSSSNGSS
jgi:hypothetical protein